MFKGKLKIHYMFWRSSRSIKTLHTPVFTADDRKTKQALLKGIKVLDAIVNSTSYNKSLLYTGKYRTTPQLISSQNQILLQHVIREYVDTLQINEVTNSAQMVDPTEKLARIGLQLFMNSHDMNIVPLASTLTCILMEQYNQYPEKDTLRGIQVALNHVRELLRQHRFIISDKDSIKALISRLSDTKQDDETMRQVLDALDYKLMSKDTVRVMKGNKTFDELDISKGWKFPAGVLDSNEAYVRSLELNEKKLIDIKKEMLVLVFDGTLRDANKILPSINYASKTGKSLLLLVTGDCLGDALTSIIINNNKNRRQGNESRTVIIKYNTKANGDLSLQENNNLIRFLQLPKGHTSIYNPEFSSCIPSKISSNQYYGRLQSLKATIGEAFLYNSVEWGEDEDEVENKFLQLTVTLYVGGNSDIIINQRRAQLDNLINNILCEGLSTGFVPGYGVALAKTIPYVSELKKEERSLITRSALDSAIMALSTPMEIALRNVYGYSKFETNNIVSETIKESNFMRANLASGCLSNDLVDIGVLEPWERLDKCILNVLNFIKLLSSCKNIIAQVFDKPKKSAQH